MNDYKSNIIFLLAGVLVFSLLVSAVPLGDTQNAMLAELAGVVQKNTGL